MARRGYSTDLTDAQWEVIAPHLPPPGPRGRPRRTDLRAVVDAILYLLRTGCQWRMLPADFPPWGTVWWYFRQWRGSVWVRAHHALFRAARAAKGQNPEPAVVIMDSQSVKTTERGALGASTATRGSRGASARSWWMATAFSSPAEWSPRACPTAGPRGI